MSTLNRFYYRQSLEIFKDKASNYCTHKGNYYGPHWVNSRSKIANTYDYNISKTYVWKTYLYLKYHHNMYSA